MFVGQKVRKQSDGHKRKRTGNDRTETQVFDLPQNGFQLTDHPWLSADVNVEEVIRFALDEIRL